MRINPSSLYVEKGSTFLQSKKCPNPKTSFQLKLYHTVIDDVIAGVRDAFLDEGVDEQVLQEMKQVWTNKLLSSKAVESNPEPLEPQPPPIIANSSKVRSFF